MKNAINVRGRLMVGAFLLLVPFLSVQSQAVRFSCLTTLASLKKLALQA